MSLTAILYMLDEAWCLLYHVRILERQPEVMKWYVVRKAFHAVEY